MVAHGDNIGTGKAQITKLLFCDAVSLCCVLAIDYYEIGFVLTAQTPQQFGSFVHPCIACNISYK
jgi:hypothetical protein